LPSPLSDKADELDLWDLDDESPARSKAQESAPSESKEPNASSPAAWENPVIPQPRKLRVVIGSDADESTSPAQPLASPGRPGIGRGKIRTGKIITSAPDDVSFDDLDDAEPSAAPLRAESPEVAEVPMPEPTVIVPSAVESEMKMDSASAPQEVTPTPDEDAAPSVAMVPVRRRVSSVQLRSLMPKLGLSRIERIGLWVLLVLLLIVGTAAYVFSILHLPEVSARAGKADFPVKGEVFTVESATTYWREPQIDGADADAVRRGTRLVPVLEMTLSRGPGVVRVLFRNADREVVGDVLTRSIESAGRVRIAATAGFDEYGMHAAYRTGGDKPWFIEVHEAVSADMPSRAFTKLLEIEISTALR
jgi:hypothetical protein